MSEAQILRLHQLCVEDAFFTMVGTASQCRTSNEQLLRAFLYTLFFPFFLSTCTGRIDFCYSLLFRAFLAIQCAGRLYSSIACMPVFCGLSFVTINGRASGLVSTFFKRAFIGMGGAFQRHQSSRCASRREDFLYGGFFRLWMDELERVMSTCEHGRLWEPYECLMGAHSCCYGS